MKDCSISIANALEILQSYTKPSIYAVRDSCFSVMVWWRPIWPIYHTGTSHVPLELINCKWSNREEYGSIVKWIHHELRYDQNNVQWNKPWAHYMGHTVFRNILWVRGPVLAVSCVEIARSSRCRWSNPGGYTWNRLLPNRSETQYRYDRVLTSWDVW